MFTSVLYRGYGAPEGFCFECDDGPPIQDDPNLYDVNVKERADLYVSIAKRRAEAYRTNHLLIPIGEDFQFMNAVQNFKNMDKLMKYINSHSSTYGVNIFYSTPSIYTKAVNDAGLVWDVKTDDFFPYGDGPHAIWSGYFTSRAPLKGYVRT